MPQTCIRTQMIGFEKFSVDELNSLRDEMMQSGLDSFQSAELLAAFLAQHGYGVSNDDACVAATRIERGRFAIPRLQAELEQLAWVM